MAEKTICRAMNFSISNNSSIFGNFCADFCQKMHENNWKRVRISDSMVIFTSSWILQDKINPRFLNRASLPDLTKATSFLKHPQHRLSPWVNKATKLVHHDVATSPSPHTNNITLTLTPQDHIYRMDQKERNIFDNYTGIYIYPWSKIVSHDIFNISLL
jgi:hypothetical protein